VRPLRHVGSLHRIRRVRQLPVVGTVEFDAFEGRTIKMRSDGRDSIASRLFWNGLTGYEPESLTPFAALARSASVILDIGANSGVFTLVAASANQDARVVAFEPAPDVVPYLRTNVALNACANVQVEPVAVGAARGTVEFLIPDELALPTGGSTRRGFRENVRSIEVPVTTVDSYVGDMELGHVDLIKIDTEGTEPEVLDGAVETLARDRPVILCEVLLGIREDELEARLPPLDYRFFKLTDRGLERRDHIVGDFGYKNYLFVPSERIDWVLETTGLGIVEVAAAANDRAGRG
jgi:FkbM family methyltransferase